MANLSPNSSDKAYHLFMSSDGCELLTKVALLFNPSRRRILIASSPLWRAKSNCNHKSKRYTEGAGKCRLYQTSKDEKGTSSRSFLLKGRRTKLAGSIFPGGRPMPLRNFIKKMLLQQFVSVEVTNCLIFSPILRRGKSRDPFKWLITLFILLKNSQHDCS